MGKPSDGGKTWTYKIRKGVKYDDGSTVTSQDVKYAVERSNFARDTLSLGPNYFQQFLKDNDGGYKGPYKDKSKAGLKSIETPDEQTVVFHLKKPFAEFDYLVSAPQTAPVPQAKDKGADYTKSVLSTGSYKFESYEEGKKLTLVRNPQWSAKTDPLRKQLPDKVVLNLKVAQSTIDKDLKSGNTLVDLAGRGVDGQTQAQLLTDPKEKANTDNTLGQRLVYTALNTKVKPFDNIECRKAVQYAIDKKAVQTSLGGPIRGELASTVLPTDIDGYQKYDLYPQKYDGDKLDLAEAKKHWDKCGAGEDHDHDPGPQRPPGRGRRGHHGHRLAQEDRCHRQDPVLPDQQVLLGLRRCAEVQQEEQRRSDHDAVGLGLPDRLRLPPADPQRQGDQPVR